MQKGLEINFYALVRHIMKRWAVLIAFGILFGVAADCYGYYRSINAAERERNALTDYAFSLGTTVENLPEHMTAELADLRGALTEEEASFVEATAKLYMYRIWASDKINEELTVGEPDGGDLEIVQTLYYANEGVQSATEIMTSEEKSYYNVLVKELSETDMSVAGKDISSSGVLQPKWILVGVVLGLFMGTCVITLAYLLSGKLRTAEDLETSYGVPLLMTGKKPQEKELESAAKGIRRLMREKKLSKLAVSAVESEDVKNVSERISEFLKAEDILVRDVASGTCTFAGDISDMDTVLFVEQIGKTKYSDLDYHISTCRNYGIPVVGCIVVE